MRCPDAQALLAAYVDHLLSPAEREQVDAHVSACEACRSELARWTEALRGLEAVAPQAAPDLWSQFQARVRVETAPLTCAEALQLVPGSGERLLTPRETADLDGHLAACTPCRMEEERLDAAVRVLEAVAASTQAPDLWPAFVARLEREQATQPAWRGWLTAARGWMLPERSAWLRPALAVGSLALAAVLLRGYQLSHPAASSSIGPAIAYSPAPVPHSVVPPVAPKRGLKSLPKTPALTHPIRIADASVVRRTGIRRARRHPLPHSSHLMASRVRPKLPEAPARRTPMLTPAATRVALSHPAEPVEENPVPQWQPGVAPEETGTVREAAQAEVVHAVAMLAGLEDTARRPFEMNADEH